MFGIFSLILALIPSLVKGIQTIHGDTVSGTTKAQMAHDALKQAVDGVSLVLTGNNAVYGQMAATIAGIAIDQTVAIAKSNGAYAKWTAIASAATTDLGVAGAATDAIKAMPLAAAAPVLSTGASVATA